LFGVNAMTESAESVPTQSTPGATWNKRWLARIAVVLAVAGWWLSVDLMLLSGGAQATNPWLRATCGSADAEAGLSDCLSVLNSKWARFEPFGPPREATDAGFALPWAALGAAYFAFVAVWYLFVGLPGRQRWGWHLLITAIVAVGAIRSAQFLYVMAFVLHRWCAGCVAAHVVNGLILVVTLLAYPWSEARVVPDAHPSRRLALATLVAGTCLWLLHVLVAVLVVFASGMHQLREGYEAIVNDPAFVVWRYEQQPVETIPLRDDEIFAGNSDAPNTVVAFIDFQCRACQLAHEVLAALVKRHGDIVRVAFRHYPQDPTCNARFKDGGHPAACRSAWACEAARRIGGPDGFHRMRTLLYERRNELELDRFSEWAAEIGLDASAFAATFESPDVQAQIKADIALGTRLGIRDVPTLFLNGRRVEHWRNPQTWIALLGLEAEQHATTSQP